MGPASSLQSLRPLCDLRVLCGEFSGEPAPAWYTASGRERAHQDCGHQRSAQAMATQYAVGVDVGGTKIYAGIINIETGEVVGTARKRTHPDPCADFFMDRLITVIATPLDD